VILNGGLASPEGALTHVRAGLDGAMLGRAAYHEPACLGRVDRLFFDPAAEDVTPEAAVLAYRPYMLDQLASGARFYAMARHMLGLFHGRPGARGWRRVLTVEGVKPGAGVEVLDRALEAVMSEAARRVDAMAAEPITA
jgi:tRNA-dihydrouridine synthase A